jgi:hypothetical protein
MNLSLIFYTLFVGCAMTGLSRAEPAAVARTAARASLGQPEAATIEQLKRAYLQCDHYATKGLLSQSDAARCSSVHEALKARAFDGDFDRMLAWWKSNRVSD